MSNVKFSLAAPERDFIRASITDFNEAVSAFNAADKMLARTGITLIRAGTMFARRAGLSKSETDFWVALSEDIIVPLEEAVAKHGFPPKFIIDKAGNNENKTNGNNNTEAG